MNSAVKLPTLMRDSILSKKFFTPAANFSDELLIGRYIDIGFSKNFYMKSLSVGYWVYK